MAELFRFRCFNCQKLMGAPASKFGKTARCPRCGVELVVPTPVEDDRDEPEEDEEENPDAVDLGALGVKLDAPLTRKPAATSLRDPGFGEPETSPVAFLESAPEPSGEPPDDATDEENAAPEGPDVPIDLSARVSPITGRRPIPIADDTLSRRRDVVVPRTVALAWSLSALLGIGFAFVAGILIGHFLWR